MVANVRIEIESEQKAKDAISLACKIEFRPILELFNSFQAIYKLPNYIEIYKECGSIILKNTQDNKIIEIKTHLAAIQQNKYIININGMTAIRNGNPEGIFKIFLKMIYLEYGNDMKEI